MRCVQCEKPTEGELNVFGCPVCCMSCYDAELQYMRSIQPSLPLDFDIGPLFGGDHDAKT